MTHRQFVVWVEWFNDAFGEKKEKPPQNSPVPLWTKESIAKAKADLAKAQLMKNLGAVKGDVTNAKR